jgi:hypothetical protein
MWIRSSWPQGQYRGGRFAHHGGHYCTHRGHFGGACTAGTAALRRWWDPARQDQRAALCWWGRTRNGLPIGLQAIGPYLEDRTPITFAALLEQAFGGFVPPPGYDE